LEREGRANKETLEFLKNVAATALQGACKIDFTLLAAYA
jgi:hypothetical protein